MLYFNGGRVREGRNRREADAFVSKTLHVSLATLCSRSITVWRPNTVPHAALDDAVGRNISGSGLTPQTSAARRPRRRVRRSAGWGIWPQVTSVCACGRKRTSQIAISLAAGRWSTHACRSWPVADCRSTNDWLPRVRTAHGHGITWTYCKDHATRGLSAVFADLRPGSLRPADGADHRRTIRTVRDRTRKRMPKRLPTAGCGHVTSAGRHGARFLQHARIVERTDRATEEIAKRIELMERSAPSPLLNAYASHRRGDLIARQHRALSEARNTENRDVVG